MRIPSSRTRLAPRHAAPFGRSGRWSRPFLPAPALPRSLKAKRRPVLLGRRSDLAAYLSREIVESAVDTGVAVRPPRPGVSYVGFVDAASGAGKDSYAVAIGHAEGDQAIIDCAHEIKPPFNPQAATLEACALIKSYNVRTVRGDKFAAGFVVEAHARNGIEYIYSDNDTSTNYIEALSLFTSGRVRLPDIPKLVTQFATLERRTTISGRDRVDHGSGDKHDDLSAAVAGALALIGGRAEKMPVYTPQMIGELRAILSRQPSRGAHRSADGLGFGHGGGFR
jgi:hypothetical protein